MAAPCRFVKSAFPAFRITVFCSWRVQALGVPPVALKRLHLTRGPVLRSGQSGQSLRTRDLRSPRVLHSYIYFARGGERPRPPKPKLGPGIKRPENVSAQGKAPPRAARAARAPGHGKGFRHFLGVSAWAVRALGGNRRNSVGSSRKPKRQEKRLAAIERSLQSNSKSSEMLNCSIFGPVYVESRFGGLSSSPNARTQRGRSRRLFL